MSQYNYSHYMSIPISGTISTFAISDDEEYIIAGDTAGSMLFLKNNGSGWSVTQNFTNAANAS